MYFKKQTLKIAGLFILFSFLNKFSIAQTKSNTPTNFYAVTGNGLKDTSWIFGTYHLINDSYLNEIPLVKKAHTKSKAVVVEIEMDSAKMMQASTAGFMFDKKLTDFLDKPFTDSLDAELKSTLQVGIEPLNQLKPMNIMITLSFVYLMKNNEELIKKYTGSPLDQYFANEGKLKGKKVIALETIEEQMNLLFNAPIEKQIEQLQYFLRNKKEGIESGNELIKTWFTHDLNKMFEISQKALDTFGSEKELLKNRNDNWMKKLPTIIQNQSTFIAVGALHLAGPDGIVNLLEQRGYTLTPIKL
ncbi:MAG: TraB/GumN family protein [Chitinophagaceae bacterium]|nr:TraB/GumN family protein [Chitinophagaceae bacterium]